MIQRPETMLRLLAERERELSEQRQRRQREAWEREAPRRALRAALAGVLVRRVRSLVGEPCGPSPVHGRVCRSLGGGCLECAAIDRWRTALGVVVPEWAIRRWLYP